MRRPYDSDDALSLSSSFDQPQPTRTLVLTDPILSIDTAVVAEDGVRLALKLYTPRHRPPPPHNSSRRERKKPVILCHGLAGNSTPFDLHGPASLAWALALQGHPVWLVNLRGAGASDRPTGGWTLNDHIRKDVPTVIRHVLRAHYGDDSVDDSAGHDEQQCHWVGHSLGGIIMLCALAAIPSLQLHVQTVTTVASAFEYAESVWKSAAPLVPVLRRIPSHDKVVLPESLTPALLSILSIYPYFLCAEKIDKEALAALEQSLEPVSLGVMQHLATAIQPGGLAITPPSTAAAAVASGAAPTRTILKTASLVAAPAADTLPPPPSPPPPPQQPHPPERYLQMMGRVRTPVLAICGDKDLQCREGAVLRMLEALGSERRRFLLVGGGEGSSSYGHMDLLLKESAAVEVFPYVCEWIATAEAAGWGPGGLARGEGEGVEAAMTTGDSVLLEKLDESSLEMR